MSVSPVEAADTFCTTMSMLISASAMARKIAAASPGLSGTPTTVTLASEVSCATPEMMACSTCWSPCSIGSLLTQVPCSPREGRADVDRDVVAAGVLHTAVQQHLGAGAASSSMSSKEIQSIFRAFFTTRGSAVKTPSTSV